MPLEARPLFRPDVVRSRMRGYAPPPRTLEEISAYILSIEKEDGLLDDLLKVGGETA